MAPFLTIGVEAVLSCGAWMGLAGFKIRAAFSHSQGTSQIRELRDRALMELPSFQIEVSRRIEEVETPMIEEIESGQVETPMVVEVRVPLVEKGEVTAMEKVHLHLVGQLDWPVIEEIKSHLVEEVESPLVEEVESSLVEEVVLPLLEELDLPMVEDNEITLPLVEVLESPMVEKLDWPMVEELESTPSKEVELFEEELESTPIKEVELSEKSSSYLKKSSSRIVSRKSSVKSTPIKEVELSEEEFESTPIKEANHDKLVSVKTKTDVLNATGKRVPNIRALRLASSAKKRMEKEEEAMEARRVASRKRLQERAKKIEEEKNKLEKEKLKKQKQHRFDLQLRGKGKAVIVEEAEGSMYVQAPRHPLHDQLDNLKQLWDRLNTQKAWCQGESSSQHGGSSQPLNQYPIYPYVSDDEDFDFEEERKNKYVPVWARTKSNLTHLVSSTAHLDPTAIFNTKRSCDIQQALYLWD